MVYNAGPCGSTVNQAIVPEGSVQDGQPAAARMGTRGAGWLPALERPTARSSPVIARWANSFPAPASRRGTEPGSRSKYRLCRRGRRPTERAKLRIILHPRGHLVMLNDDVWGDFSVHWLLVEGASCDELSTFGVGLG